MCLSIVYRVENGKRTEVMRDVARIAVEGGTVILVDLFGISTCVEGTIETVDLVDEHAVTLRPSGKGGGP